MKNQLYLFGLGILLASCGGESSETTQTADTTKTDSVITKVPNIDIDEEALMAKFTISTVVPWKQDSGFLQTDSIVNNEALTADEAKYLTYGFVDNDMSYQGLMPVDDFLFFDSLKAINEYESYREVADIGMMVMADAYVVQKLKLDDSTTLLLWAVYFATYEACPYSSGTILYASVYKNNEVTSCTIIGEDSGGADAPVWGETLVLSSFENGKYTAVKFDRNCDGETTEDGEDVVTESSVNYTLSINPQGIWEVTSIE